MDNENKKSFDFIKKIIDNEKYKKIIIIAGLLGIALIFLSSFVNFGTKNKQSTEETASTTQVINTDSYETSLQNRLCEIVSSIDGAGRTKVLITLDSSSENVYAANIKNSGQTESSQDSEKDYITVKLSDGTEVPVNIKEIEPTIRGVLVVCQGGEDSIIQQRVLNAVTKALNITSDKVCVTKLSN
ncbi:MAG: hypothetical protein Q8876_03205 [Bacillota bacterium]|nr:hypothetical protein [Bacillota bacterium]